jgi:hypothetical protein
MFPHEVTADQYGKEMDQSGRKLMRKQRCSSLRKLWIALKAPSMSHHVIAVLFHPLLCYPISYQIRFLSSILYARGRYVDFFLIDFLWI